MSRSLSDFEGSWCVSRQITPAVDPPGRFHGEATWARVPQGLAYHEIGELQVGAHPAMQAERRYLWRDDLTVWFEDGRFFHQVPPDGGETGHWCDPDQYDVSYDFATWPEFRVTWRVRGPAKDYTMVTEYTPAS